MKWMRPPKEKVRERRGTCLLSHLQALVALLLFLQGMMVTSRGRKPALATLAIAMVGLVVMAEATDRPIWGIMTQPSSDGKRSIIDEESVKWLESSGSRVVPVSYDASHEQLRRTFNSINGLLYPGGADVIDHTLYYNASRFMFKLALEANKRGDYFPVHGTCLGFELLCEMVDQGDFNVLTHFDAENISLPLIFHSDPRESRLFSLLQGWHLEALKTKPLTQNSHHYGVSVEDWKRSRPLTTFFNLLTTSIDRNSRKFVSSIEAKGDLPIYAVQWHPEKSLFEWAPHEDVDHSLVATEVMQLVGDFLVQESKRSDHTYATVAAVEEEDMV